MKPLKEEFHPLHPPALGKPKDFNIPRSVQGQLGWGLEHPGTGEVVPAHGE